jgi:transposase-like protein
MALATDDSRASVVRRLGNNETTLRNWVANYLAEQERQADPPAVSLSEFEELRRLRREVEELRAEKEKADGLRPPGGQCVLSWL